MAVGNRFPDLVLDPSPQLGANLDLNGNNIGGVTPTEVGYISGITSAVQTQLDAKLVNLIEDVTPQLGANLDLNGNNIGGVTPTEVGYISGITSAIQTQLDAKLVNLIEDVTPQLGANLDTNGNNIVLNTTKGILDANSNEQILFTQISSAVNHFNITNAATGNGPVLSVLGSDSDINFNIAAKANGLIVMGNSVALTIETLFNISSDKLVDFGATASAVNNLKINATATGNGPILESVGDDTNVDLNINSKGTGDIFFNGIAATTVGFGA